jgi:hypothetical protein
VSGTTSATAAPALVVGHGGIRIEFDRTTGAITEIGDRSLGLRINDRRAECWRLLVPLPERRGHQIRSSDQRLRDAEPVDDQLRLTWGPLRSEGRSFDIEVVVEVRPTEAGVVFSVVLENRSDCQVEEVTAPCIAGIVRPQDPRGWRMVGPRIISGAWEYELFDSVPSSYHGARKTNVLHPYPGGWTNEMSLGMPWVVLEQSQGPGLYIANDDPEIAFSCFMSEYDVEMRLDAEAQAAFGNSAPQRWPTETGDESTLALGWTLFPFAEPGQTFTGPPIALELIPEGGWRAAVEHFRVGLERRQGPSPRRPTWLADSDGWTAICMMFNDGSVVHRPSDLPRIAADAAAVGITTILLMGWSNGGLDGGFPFYNVDPRLGSEDEFRDALAGCRERGVRVVLMAQLQQVCPESDWFRSEGHAYLVQNPHGDPYYSGGVFYGNNTTLDQLGFTAPQILTANPAHERFREHAIAELTRIVDYGADGVLIDKLHTGDPYSLDFNPNLPGTPATRFHRALAESVREFADAVAEHDQFAIAAECGWDRMMPFCEAAFSRYFERDHLPVQELAFPGVRVTTTLVGDTDTNMINNALRHGHVVCLEPHYVHGEVASLPNVSRYLGEALALRRELRPLLWEGRVADPSSVSVAGDLLHGVFEAPGDGGRPATRAVVLNHFESDTRAALVGVPEGAGMATVHRPFAAPQEVELPGMIEVPAGEYVVIVTERPS